MEPRQRMGRLLHREAAVKEEWKTVAISSRETRLEVMTKKTRELFDVIMSNVKDLRLEEQVHLGTATLCQGTTLPSIQNHQYLTRLFPRVILSMGTIRSRTRTIRKSGKSQPLGGITLHCLLRWHRWGCHLLEISMYRKSTRMVV